MGSAHLAVLEVVGPDPPSKSLREHAPHHLHGDFARVCKNGMMIFLLRGENSKKKGLQTQPKLGFACMMLGKSSKNMIPNGVLTVIYQGKK